MNHRSIAALAAAAFALAAFSITPALADPTIDDVHCMIVDIKLMSSPDQTVKAAGTVTEFYYMGKLIGRDPKLDMESLVIAELPKMTGPVLQAEAQRCSVELKALSDTDAQMGKDIQQKAAPTPQPDDSK